MWIFEHKSQNLNTLLCVFVVPPPATPVRCNHRSCESVKDHERGLGLPLSSRDSVPILDSILREISSIRQFLDRRDECRAIAREWLQVGYVLDVLLFRVYLVAVLAYSITLGTLWSVWQNS